MLADMFDGLDTFGKTSQQVEGSSRLFMDILGDFQTADVKAAFKQYLLTATEFPKPAQIAKLIERGKHLDSADGVQHMDKETLNRKADYYGE